MQKGYTLLDALRNRRSRRFGKGMRLEGGPLAYASEHAPQPLTAAEEAALVFAACGITGYALGELPYARGERVEDGGGQILLHLVGRTIPSGDAAHTTALFVINDDGAWYIRRPQDYPRAEIASLIALAREGRLEHLYERSRVRVAAERPDVPREMPFTMPFNRWSANVPGSTLFLPVAELSALSINILLLALGEAQGIFILDDRRAYQPAGLAPFARSKGGHLYDDPAANRVATISTAQDAVYEFAAIEQGAMLQNLGLMAAALDVGGFSFFAAHPYGWMEALGFRMVDVSFTRAMGVAPPLSWLIRLLGRDRSLPTAVGLEQGKEVLLRPYCPPYYRNMEEAVLAFVDYKWGAGQGTLRDSTASGWRDADAVQAQIPAPSDRAVAATIAYCEYVYERFGRFPPGNGPFRTVLAYQAQHLDKAFYRRFYRQDAYANTDQNGR